MERRFGVEIECVGLGRITALQNLLDEGVRVYDAGYSHTTSSQWKIVSDGSLSLDGGTAAERQYAFEIVSPVLQGEAGLQEVKKVVDILYRSGATVNRTCGLHIHIDASGLTVDDVKTIVSRYATHEEEIDKVMPPSRRLNNCRCAYSIKGSVASSVMRSSVRTTAELARATASRFMKVNLHPLRSYGTIEFRQHGGTVESDKIINWVRFLQSFVSRSVQISRVNGGRRASRTVGRRPRPGTIRAKVLEMAENGYSAGSIMRELQLRTNDVHHRMTVLIRDYNLSLRSTGWGLRMTWVATTQESTVPITATSTSPIRDESPWDGCSLQVAAYYRDRAAKFGQTLSV
jgi:hypothetical protein